MDENSRIGAMETITIKLVAREDGLFISSDDVPGLWIWGSDPERVMNNVIPTIQHLYKLNRGISVDVKAADPPKSARFSGGIESFPHSFNIFMRKQEHFDNVHG